MTFVEDIIAIDHNNTIDVVEVHECPIKEEPVEIEDVTPEVLGTTMNDLGQ